MVAGSILPITFYKGELYFLFGKENELADTPGFSDFGGTVEGNETPYETALREGGEELTGFLGDDNDIQAHLDCHGGFYHMIVKTYHIHVIYIDYDENLPRYYNHNHQFLWKRMDQKMLNETRLFEKIEIDWFSQTDLQKRRKEFRNFYQIITDSIIKEIPAISAHFKQYKKKTTRTKKISNRTRKMKGGQ